MYLDREDVDYDEVKRKRDMKIAEGNKRIRRWISTEKNGGPPAIQSWIEHLELIIARPKGGYRLPHLIKDHLGLSDQRVIVEDGAIFLIRKKTGKNIEKGLMIAQRELSPIS